jgi:hypothetical protein
LIPPDSLSATVKGFILLRNPNYFPMPPKSTEPSNYSLDEMVDRLREGDRGKRSAEEPELVTRADGSQVMRVRKRKRRTEQTATGKPVSEKKERSKVPKLIAFGGAAVGFLVILVFSLLQLAKFNSASYHRGLEGDVSTAVGGTASVSRLSVTPIKARAERVSLSWPESSVLRSVQLRGVEAGVGLTGFFGANWNGEQIFAKSGEVRVVGGDSSQFPVAQGSLPFGHGEFLCERMDVVIGAGKKPPVILEGIELSVRTEASGRQVIIHGGTAAIRGWGEMIVGNGAMRFEDGGCWLSTLRLKPSQGRGDLILKSTEVIRPGEAARLEMELINMNLGHLLGSKVGRLLNGTVDATNGLVQISPAGFSETSLLIPVKGHGGELRGFPFLLSLRTILGDTEFAKPYFHEISAAIHRVGDDVRIEDLVLSEKGFMEVRGSIIVNAEGSLSGALRIGIHENKAINSAGRKRSLAFSDPVAGFVWFDLKLSGTSEFPDDNWKMLLQQAARDGAALRQAETERRSAQGKE